MGQRSQWADWLETIQGQHWLRWTLVKIKACGIASLKATCPAVKPPAIFRHTSLVPNLQKDSFWLVPRHVFRLPVIGRTKILKEFIIGGFGVEESPTFCCRATALLQPRSPTLVNLSVVMRFMHDHLFYASLLLPQPFGRTTVQWLILDAPFLLLWIKFCKVP